MKSDLTDNDANMGELSRRLINRCCTSTAVQAKKTIESMCAISCESPLDQADVFFLFIDRGLKGCSLNKFLGF